MQPNFTFIDNSQYFDVGVQSTASHTPSAITPMNQNYDNVHIGMVPQVSLTNDNTASPFWSAPPPIDNTWDGDTDMSIPPRVTTEWATTPQNPNATTAALPLPYTPTSVPVVQQVWIDPRQQQPAPSIRRRVRVAATRQQPRRQAPSRPRYLQLDGVGCMSPISSSVSSSSSIQQRAPPRRRRVASTRRVEERVVESVMDRPRAALISQAADYLTYRLKCLETQASKIKHAFYMLSIDHGLGKNPSGEDFEWALYRMAGVDPQVEGFILDPFNSTWEALEQQHPKRTETKTKQYIQMRQAPINWVLSAYLVKLAARTSRCTTEAFLKIDVSNRLSYLLSLGWKSGRGNATLLIPFNTWKQEGFRRVVNEVTEFDAKGKWDMFEVAKQCFASGERELVEMERAVIREEDERMHMDDDEDENAIGKECSYGFGMGMDGVMMGGQGHSSFDADALIDVGQGQGHEFEQGFF